MKEVCVQGTSYGFKWGPAEIIRLFEDDKEGVFLEILGKRQTIRIRVTWGGNIRIAPVRNTFHPKPKA